MSAMDIAAVFCRLMFIPAPADPVGIGLQACHSHRLVPDTAPKRLQSPEPCFLCL